jgi:AcrR family transcriptional regulator
VARGSETRERIQEVARELFASKGVQKTSLQEIADRLGLTKPALYYHFSSREELVRSIVTPLIDDGEAFIRSQEELEVVEPRALIEGYFDFHYQHRADVVFMLSELTTLSELGMIELVLSWRMRLAEVLMGPNPPLPKATRAVVALGGVQDCTIQFPDAPREELRRTTVDAACAALGV